MPNTLKVGVIISGRGSNLQSLLAATAAPGFPAQIVTVLSNRPAAGGLAHARAAGVPGEVVDHKAYPRREDFEAALTASLERAAVDLRSEERRVGKRGVRTCRSRWAPV